MLLKNFEDMNVSEIKDFVPALTPSYAPPSIGVHTTSQHRSPLPSPAGLWAAIAAKPAAPIVPPAMTPSSTYDNNRTMTDDGIQRNRKGRRIDPSIVHDKKEVERVNRLKVISYLHLLRLRSY